MSAVRVVPPRFEQTARYKELGDRWREHPYLFFEEALGVTYLTPDQRTLVDAYMTHRHVACTSGHSTGKTFVVALIVLHFLVTNVDSIVITTSASWELVENTLWREIRQLHMGARMPLGGELLQASLEFGEKWFAVGLSTNDPTKFQGKHASRVMVVIDEATGVPGFIFDAAEAMAVGSNDRIFATANPTDPTCAFYDEMNPGEGRTSRWHHVVISCLNHPNVIEGREVIKGAVTREWVAMMREAYGETHPTFEARVLGRWSRTLGRMFPDFSLERHVFDPSKLAIQPWWPHWIALDWGFRHDSAVLFLAYDGHTIYVYDEILVNGLTASALGDAVGQRANPQFGMGVGQKFDAVYLAHDAFGHQGESVRTRAEMFTEAIVSWGLPAAERASVDRVGGFNLITTVLRNDSLRVSRACPHLIAAIPEAMRDPKKPEDMLKVEGDDLADALYKGVIARPGRLELPREIQIAQQITAKTPHDIALQSRLLNSEGRFGDGPAFATMRRGYR